MRQSTVERQLAAAREKADEQAAAMEVAAHKAALKVGKRKRGAGGRVAKRHRAFMQEDASEDASSESDDERQRPERVGMGMDRSAPTPTSCTIGGAGQQK